MASTRNEYSTLHSRLASHDVFGNLSDEMQICLHNCLRAAQVCEQTIQHCLHRGGQHANPDHIRLLQDCADICHLTANFLNRDSYFHPKVCEACAVICLACFIECDRITDDQIMRLCAETCRRCAESCNQMVPAQH